MIPNWAICCTGDLETSNYMIPTTRKVLLFGISVAANTITVFFLEQSRKKNVSSMLSPTQVILLQGFGSIEWVFSPILTIPLDVIKKMVLCNPVNFNLVHYQNHGSVEKKLHQKDWVFLRTTHWVSGWEVWVACQAWGYARYGRHGRHCEDFHVVSEMDCTREEFHVATSDQEGIPIP